MSDMRIARTIAGHRTQDTEAAKDYRRRRLTKDVEVRHTPEAVMNYARARAEEIGGTVKVQPDGTVVVLNG